MKKITEIYSDYNIMPNLAMHQMRTASVAMQICDSLDMEVDRDNIINACLIHDMGNIIKFHLEYFPDLLKPEGLEYWQKIKYDFIMKYGNDEHLASQEIAKELGLSDYAIELINDIEPVSIETIASDDDFSKKVCIYSDNRVTPFGIVSAKDRNIEAKERYKNHPHAFEEEKRRFFMENIYLIENQIFAHSNIKTEDINDESIKKYLDKLVDFSM